jgi:hypothetical protein
MQNKKSIIVAKRHTVKNTIVSDSERRVIFLGRTFEGSTHDYKMFQKETK